MPDCEAGDRKGLTIKFDCYGNILPVYRFIRLPVQRSIRLCFVVEAGYIVDPSKPLMLIIDDQKIRLIGDPGKMYTAEYVLEKSGTFPFGLEETTGSFGIIQLPPRLMLNKQLIGPDHISLQTVVSKWMGSLDMWDEHLKASSKAGYNMIHFTPLQQRGMSNSPYSLYDHLELADDLFHGDKENASSQYRLQGLNKKISFMEEELCLLSIIDVVWNHISCDSPALATHPEIGYTLENSKHLRVAYELDECILMFSNELLDYQVDPQMKNEDDVRNLLNVFVQQALPNIALWEYFVIDVSKAVGELESIFRREAAASPTLLTPDMDGVIINLKDAIMNDGEYQRGSHKMDIRKVTKYYRTLIDQYRSIRNESDRSLLLSKALGEYRSCLDQINYPRYQQYDRKIERIVHNLFNRITYERIADHGPKMGSITDKSPMASTYFTRIKSSETGNVIAFANNGWIWDADPLVNFAEATCDVYFTRDVIVWGDCVKLRYGNSYEDCPWLWQYMTLYTEQMASIFHGFRIDNCHSTPLHVAEYLLDKARLVRPELYVIAELFTGNEERDMLFVTTLGLNSLIREAMVAWDPAELTRTTSKYGGQSAYSPFDRSEHVKGISPDDLFAYSTPHALYMDCTHDNEMPAQKRTAQDCLSNAAIVSMCTAAIGSVRGYDDLVPKHLNIVNEQRTYPKPDIINSGLWEIRRQLNQLHWKIVEEGMSFIKVHQDHDLVIVERRNLNTGKGFILIARTAFNQDNAQSIQTYNHIKFDTGMMIETILSATINVVSISNDKVINSNNVIDTLEANVIISSDQSTANEMISLCGSLDGKMDSINIQKDCFPAGGIVILQTKDSNLPNISSIIDEAIKEIKQLDLLDLNVLLYRCASEENDGSIKRGTYNVPGYGDLPYAGLEGFMSVIRRIEADPNDCHPFCANISSGDWAFEYLASRLDRKEYPKLQSVNKILQKLFISYQSLSPTIKVRIFFQIVKSMYLTACDRAIKLMPTIEKYPEFAKKLALTSVQLIGQVDSTGLYPAISGPSLSAGLPHFSTHHMRCWGRDTFISLSGLMLTTGRYELAKTHLLAFASCCYRGLIPNLLDSGRRPRYNARDATWWFLSALQSFYQMVPNGKAILDVQVSMRFPNDIYVDFDDPSIFSRKKTVLEIVQSIMQAHAEGIEFREWNAGPALDSMMKDEGFNINIKLDPITGFIFGGNEHNCGTWMDKMGESEKANNRGIPATSRDGAAIEIIALIHSTLKWLISLENENVMSVNLSDGSKLSYLEWKNRLEANFEKSFFIPVTNLAFNDDEKDKLSITHQGIYKDTFKATNSKGDYQFRPNMIVAMSIAPDLFCKKHVKLSLAEAEKVLIGPLGIKTLASDEKAYNPYYDNSNDSKDGSVAKGFNYHQGPEWVWLYGCYLKALLHFNCTSDLEERERMLFKHIRPHIKHLQDSSYAGLAELTNKNGEHCSDSCSTQAWSSATLLEVFHSLYK